MNSMERFDRVFWRRLWRLAKPFWVSDQKRKARTLLAVMLVMILLFVGFSAVFSYINRDVVDALQKYDQKRFHFLLMLSFIWICFRHRGLSIPALPDWQASDSLARMDDRVVRRRGLPPSCLLPDEPGRQDRQSRPAHPAGSQLVHQLDAQLYQQPGRFARDGGRVLRNPVDDLALAGDLADRLFGYRHLRRRYRGPPPGRDQFQSGTLRGGLPL